jgi:hypothetical protein
VPGSAPRCPARERERGRLKRPVKSPSGSPPAKWRLVTRFLTGTPTFLLPTERVDDADRAGLQMAENGARAAGTSLISFYTPDEMLALARDAGFNGTRYVCGSVARRALLRQSDRRSSPIQRRGSPGRDHLTDRAQRSTR